MGKDKIGQIMKRVSTQGLIESSRKTSYSAKKTMITKLANSNVPDSQIMHLSGHKNVQASLKQQQHYVTYTEFI